MNNKNRNRSSIIYFVKIWLKIENEKNIDDIKNYLKINEVRGIHYKIFSVNQLILFECMCIFFISKYFILCSTLRNSKLECSVYWYFDQPGAFLISNQCASNPYLALMICDHHKTCPPTLMFMKMNSVDRFYQPHGLFCSVFIYIHIFHWSIFIEWNGEKKHSGVYRINWCIKTSKQHIHKIESNTTIWDYENCIHTIDSSCPLSLSKWEAIKIPCAWKNMCVYLWKSQPSR